MTFCSLQICTDIKNTMILSGWLDFVFEGGKAWIIMGKQKHKCKISIFLFLFIKKDKPRSSSLTSTYAWIQNSDPPSPNLFTWWSLLYLSYANSHISFATKPSDVLIKNFPMITLEIFENKESQSLDARHYHNASVNCISIGLLILLLPSNWWREWALYYDLNIFPVRWFYYNS